MKISFIIPRWPKNSFWDVIAFKFPLLSSSLLAGLTPSHHQFRIIDESLAEIDFDQEVDLVAITAITPLAPRGYEIADEFRRRGKKVVIGGIHASWLPEEAKAHSDSVAIGEADEVWVEILEDAEKGTDEAFLSPERENRSEPSSHSEKGSFSSQGLPLSQSGSDHKGMSL